MSVTYKDQNDNFIKKQITESQEHGLKQETLSLQLLKQARDSEDIKAQVVNMINKLEEKGLQAKSQFEQLNEKNMLTRNEMHDLLKCSKHYDLIYYCQKLKTALNFSEKEPIDDQVMVSVGAWRKLLSIVNQL
ncbi:hypothetical protein [Alkalibacillus silvisoli]|uniref:Uncharacterized protein n=1 Tax=Alkalibacillus silvisoli TaxID=392823 RepID=A0ABN0ZKX8_9BACI